MKKFKMGVIIDSLGLGFDKGLEECSKLRVEGIQVYTVSGDMSPENLNKEKIKKIRSQLDYYGLEISALCGDLGGHGFEIAEENISKIKRSKTILDLAGELGTKIVTTHIGVIPEDRSSEKRRIMSEACHELGSYADTMGMHFAIETGPEKATTLKSFLDDLDCNGMGVNFDPANLVMVTGDDPVEGAKTLARYIVHTHAKDGIMLNFTEPEIIYNYFASGGIGDLRLEECFIETPLGEGKVDFVNYLKALESIGYKGYLTIERETGTNPLGDIKKAVDFLKGMI